MFKVLLLFAVVIRILLMPISVHPDLFFINTFPNLLLSDKIFNIALYFDQNLPDKEYTYYLPLTYYFFAAFQFINGLLSNTYSPWMHDLLEHLVTGKSAYPVDFIKSAPNPHLFKDIFLAKVPYLIFDIAVVIVFFKSVKNLKVAKTMILIWLFNPVLIYGVYIMGQFEIIPSFFILLGFILMRKNLQLGIISLGIAAAFKSYAILLIIPVALIYGHSFIDRLKLLILGSLPYIIFLIPTLFSSADQVIYSFLPKVYLHYRKPIEGWSLYSQTVKYTFLSLSLLLIYFLAYFLKIKDKYKLTLGLGLTSFLLVYALAPRISFHYLLWEVPLIVLFFKNSKTIVTLIVVQAISLASYKLLANHLQAGLFAPLNPNLFSSIPPFNDLVNQFIPYRIISSTGFFVFLFVNLYYSAKILGQLIFQKEAKLYRK